MHICDKNIQKCLTIRNITVINDVCKWEYELGRTTKVFKRKILSELANKEDYFTKYVT